VSKVFVVLLINGQHMNWLLQRLLCDGAQRCVYYVVLGNYEAKNKKTQQTLALFWFVPVFFIHPNLSEADPGVWRLAPRNTYRCIVKKLGRFVIDGFFTGNLALRPFWSLIEHVFTFTDV
jgi:hypothetical protein